MELETQEHLKLYWDSSGLFQRVLKKDGEKFQRLTPGVLSHFQVLPSPLQMSKDSAWSVVPQVIYYLPVLLCFHTGELKMLDVRYSQSCQVLFGELHNELLLELRL